jgi:DNA replicative helicase MCM subunit Mcm2 (Cdc46/Mcm family)
MSLYETSATSRKLSVKKVAHKDMIQGMPVCMEDILENGWRKQGQRNEATMHLINYLVSSGYSDEEVLEIVNPWSLASSLRTSSDTEVLISNKATLKWSRETEAYVSCSSIRALGDGTDRPMPCSRGDCLFVTKKSIHDMEATKVEIGSVDSDYVGTKVKIRGTVSQADPKPFIVPGEVVMECAGHDKYKPCQMCPYELIHKGNKRYGIEDNTILKMAQFKSREIPIHKASMGIPQRCDLNKVEVIEGSNLNVRAFEMRPMIDIRDPDNSSKFKDRRLNVYLTGKWEMEAGGSYEVEGIVQVEPDSKKVCIIANKCKSISEEYLNYKVTDTNKKMLKEFEAKEDTVESVTKQWKKILTDMKRNVHFIKGRERMAAIVDLVFHSVNRFSFLNQDVKNGWLEALIIGDTGVAKSNIIDKMINFYGVGQRISMEQVTEAGLIGTSHENKTTKQWTASPGLLTHNDMGLVVFDECHSKKGGKNNNPLSQITNVRSEGKVTIVKAGSAEFPARCRKIFVANPDSEKRTNQFNYPVEMISGIFDSQEDQRRTDLFIAVPSLAKTDFRERHLIQDMIGTPKFHAGLSRELINWIWSRKPEHIQFKKSVDILACDLASELSQTFSDRIPLVDDGTIILKLAKLAAGIAARMHSTDSAGEKVIVKDCHMRVGYEFLMGVYTSRKESGYLEYSKIYNARDNYTDEEYEIIKAKCLNSFGHTGQLLCQVLLESATFTARELRDVWENEEVIKRMFGIFRKHNVAEVNTKNRYTLTTKGMKVVRRLAEIDQGWGELAPRESFRDFEGEA